MKNFDVRLVILFLSCFILPLFIGDEKRLENPIDLLGEDPTKDKTETSRWEPTQQISLLSVDRAVNCQLSDFRRPLGKRSTGQSTVKSPRGGVNR